MRELVEKLYFERIQQIFLYLPLPVYWLRSVMHARRRFSRYGFTVGKRRRTYFNSSQFPPTSSFLTARPCFLFSFHRCCTVVLHHFPHHAMWLHSFDFPTFPKCFHINIYKRKEDRKYDKVKELKDLFILLTSHARVVWNEVISLFYMCNYDECFFQHVDVFPIFLNLSAIIIACEKSMQRDGASNRKTQAEFLLYNQL